MAQLEWLPEPTNFRTRVKALTESSDVWQKLVVLANSRLDFSYTNALDDAMRRLVPSPPVGSGTKPVRLAILGSSTLSHLHAGIRVAGLRRSIHVATYEANYGQYLQELLDPHSELYDFKPDAVLFALDSYHLTQGLHAALSRTETEVRIQDALAKIAQCWTLARDAFNSTILHQVPLNPFPTLLGNNEHRLPGSRADFIDRLNVALRTLAEQFGIDLVSIDRASMAEGLSKWHDVALWHRSKQEVSPLYAPSYGDLVGRLLAARQGRSAKCLVLDLDNTVWGGVIGDDGLDGIVLGQGSALGEAFAGLQTYAKELARRGVILAVCSKNDRANAIEPFEKHPEMVLRMKDIAAFRANWEDKPNNLRAIAEELNIGLDSLVFLDDNPFERNLVREALPMVAVPEIPNDDPALMPAILATAGYFECVVVTDEDLQRSTQYQENGERRQLKENTTDLEGYLRALEMHLTWSRFDSVGLPRIVQLINKTNQFNLTTRRYTEDDIRAIMADEQSFGIQIRLADRFGDNGIIAVVIGKMLALDVMTIDTWLMSCRVLGRQVESTTLNLIAAEAKALGAMRLRGEYIPTKKNEMVRDHYKKLGFTTISRGAEGCIAELNLTGFTPSPTFIHISESQ